MKTFRIILFAILIIYTGCASPLPEGYKIKPVDDAVEGINPMVHQEGMTIVDLDGNPLQLHGVLLEGWLQWNGPLWGAGLTSETQIANRLTQLVGPEAFAAFRTAVYDNFITEGDIVQIANLGFNVVRVPINRHVLESPDGAVDMNAPGWGYLDRLLEWCTRHNVYVILDLHSAPGGQSGVFVADPDEVKLWDSAENEAQTVALWRAIAARYKDAQIVAGYDLLNEPGYTNPEQLVDLYIRIITAIREVDPYHMVIIEGNLIATDFSIFDRPLSANQAYSFHTYNFLSDDVDEAQMAKLVQIAESQNVPLWNGEFGAHNVGWVAGTTAMFAKPENHVSGWIFWPWKRVPEADAERWRGLMDIPSTAAWDLVRLDVAFSIDPPNPAVVDVAQQGMDEFLESMRAEALVVDQEMADVLTQFKR